jgi:hypothetical protein
VPYGWLIKHKATGHFAIVAQDGKRLSVTTTPNPDDATMFAYRAHAVNVLEVCTSTSVTFPACEIVDHTTPEPQPADQDQGPVPTREELVEAAIASGEERRRRHAAARAAAREKPTARLIEKGAR